MIEGKGALLNGAHTEHLKLIIGVIVIILFN